MAIRALYVTSEVYPLAKTGGLADVSAALPAALRDVGIDVRLVVPAYPQALNKAPNLRVVAKLGGMSGYGEGRLLETVLQGSRVPVWLVDYPALYNRDGGLYQAYDGQEWSDNARRFAALNETALAIADGLVDNWRADIVHAHDWHAGLLPLLLSIRPKPRPATIFTIHNLAYQGLFDAHEFKLLDLPSELFGSLEFYGRISFLKAGISGADAITTVSPTYAREILTPDFSCGLEGLMKAKEPIISGILNGADYGVWDPRSDPDLVAHYSPRSMAGKLASKRAIQAELNLEADDDAPLMAFMSRLVHQKMPDVVLEALPPLIDDGLQFALVAEGEAAYGKAFEHLVQRYKGRVGTRFGYGEGVAHRLLAGADMLAHPARFEPCGLVPMYGLRYGTLPIVRNSGGMADSVVNATAETIQNGTATGFSFDQPTKEAFEACVRRALGFYRQPIVWRKMQASAMAQDFGWQRSAAEYARLYHSLAGVPMVVVERGEEETELTRVRIPA
jgi:starch synthase